MKTTQEIQDEHFENIATFSAEDLKKVIETHKGEIIQDKTMLNWTKNGQDYKITLPFQPDETNIKKWTIEKSITPNRTDIYLKDEKGWPRNINFYDNHGQAISLNNEAKHKKMLNDISLFNKSELEQIIQKQGVIAFNKPSDWQVNGETYKIVIPSHLDQYIMPNYKVNTTIGPGHFEFNLTDVTSGVTIPIAFQDQKGRLIELSGADPLTLDKLRMETAKNEVKESKILNWLNKKHNNPIPKTDFSYYEKESDSHFILTTQHNTTQEKTSENSQQFKQTSRVFIENGVIKNKQGMNSGAQTDISGIYVMDKNGHLYVNSSPIHHSYILKNDYTGKPISCGGKIKIANGKVMSIDNWSGHYHPSDDQLILAIQHLHKKGVMDPNAQIHSFANQKLKLEDVLAIDPKKLVAKYQPLEYYEQKHYISPSQKKKNQGPFI